MRVSKGAPARTCFETLAALAPQHDSTLSPRGAHEVRGLSVTLRSVRSTRLEGRSNLSVTELLFAAEWGTGDKELREKKAGDDLDRRACCVRTDG